MRSYRTGLLSGVLLAAAAAGCSNVPTAEIEAARKASEDARSAEAGTYAREEMTRADDVLKQLDAELALQQEKFALFRSYERVAELAAEAKSAGEQAVTAAATGKERVREQARTEIAQARAMLDEVKTMLAKAPTGKGTAADLAAMRSDIAGAETALADVDRAFEAGRYMDAETGAASARASIENVRTAILTATKTRSAAKRG